MDDLKPEHEMEDLMARLKACNKPYLDNDKKLAIRKNLMSKLDIQPHVREEFSLYSLIGAIRLLAEKIWIAPAQRAMIKEKLMETVESSAQKRFFWSNFFAFGRRALSAALIVFLVFGLFSFLNFNISVVNAATFTTLDAFSGDIHISRGGRFMSPANGMQILENDQLITGADGSAVIRYFDNSVTRLANDTEIVVNKLRRSGKNSFDSYVEVTLVDGRVWSRVVNLVETKASFVVKAKDIYASAKKAAFNVEVDSGKLEIGVFNHAVDVSSDGKVERVISGEKLIVDNGSTKMKTSARTDKNTDWVKENLKNDREYLEEVEQQLLEAKRKSVGLDNSTDVSFETSLKEDAFLFLTIDDVKKKKMELDLAERNFVAAQVKLHDPNITPQEKIEAELLISGFADHVKDFYEVIDEVAHTDKAYSEELKIYVESKVLNQKKDLSVVLPDSPAYAAKKMLDEVELLSADTETELVQLKVDQAADKLAIAEDVKERGDSELVSQIVDEYKQDMTGVSEMMDNLEEVKPEIKEEMEERMADNFDLLQVIDVAPVIVEVTNVEPAVNEDDEDVASEVVAGDDSKADEPETVIDGPYGVEIKGDKPLPPLLQNIE